MLKVKSNTLLLLACIVWIIAGYNVMHIGFLAYPPYFTVLNLLLSAVVFCCFWFFVFSRLVKKHTARIKGFGAERQLFFKFFDAKSFIIMVFMMGGGIWLRVSGVAPEQFIAVFYSGLGTALFMAGVLFGINYGKAMLTRQGA